MKRLFFLFFTLCACALVFCFPAAPQKTARAESAEEVYAVAEKDGVWFYSEPLSEKGLFILPETYYVRVLENGDPFCKVQYLNKTGYCRKSELHFVDFVPVRPFLNYEYNVPYTVGSGTSFGDGMLGSIDRTVSYYGNFLYGTETYYYVYADGKFGYVPKTQEIIYEKNTDYLVPVSAEGDVENKPSSGKGLSGVEIAVICVACAACIVVALFVLRGKKPPVKQPDEPADL